ncbi:MAG: polymer-forming cytoskeletal protein [Phycisphaeraceae bacterium]|nr:polymer-forming cytoskeletal protein [Phycisphaeraceae bacterium]
MAEHRSATTTVIGPDTHIKGEMVFDSSARILGTFEGRITAKGEVEIGEGAACKASIEATTVIVDGLVEGDVMATERAQLNVKARVVGDIVATTLVVAEGASFIGHCRVGADALKNAPGREERPAAATEVTTRRASKPVVVAPVSVNTKTNDLEATLAGLEARLAGLGRRASNATETADNGA